MSSASVPEQGEPDPGQLLRAPGRRVVRLSRTAALVHAYKLLRSANARELAILVTSQVVLGVLIVAELVVAARVFVDLFVPGDGAALVPPVLAIVGLSAMFGFTALLALYGNTRETLLAETARSKVEHDIGSRAAVLPLAALEDPTLRDWLLQASIQGQSQPMMITRAMIAMLGSLVVCAFAGTVVAVTVPILLPLIVAAVVPAWFARARLGRALHAFHSEHTQQERARQYLVSLLTARAAGQEVRAFALAPELLARRRALYQERLTDLRVMLQRHLAPLAGGVAVMTAVLGLGLWLVVDAASSGAISASQAVAGSLAAVQLVQRLTMLIQSAATLDQGALFLADYVALREISDDYARRARPPRLAPARGLGRLERFELEGVSFTYPGAGPPALSDVSISVDRGSIVALVGPNGGGKTTLVKILARLYPLDAGRIRWNGADITGADPARVQECISVLFQDFMRYDLTARDNVEFGRTSARGDDLRLLAATRRARAHPVIDELPLSYETMLSPEYDKGVDLSAGQWQRIAMARALYRDAPLLVLDEPSSALDAETEASLLRQIADNRKDAAVLVISHRLHSVLAADYIYVLDQGRVVQEGSTEAVLAEAGGKFRDLFAAQLDEAELGAEHYEPPSPTLA